MPLILSFPRREKERCGGALACRCSRGAGMGTEALDEGPFSPREKDRMRGATGGRASARPASGGGTRAVGFRTREVPGDTEGVSLRLPDELSPEFGEEPFFYPCALTLAAAFFYLLRERPSLSPHARSP